MKVAFIGLGIMGSRMAANLLKHEVSLSVYNRSIEASHNLRKLGATVASTTSEAVNEADIVFSMLSTPEVVESVFLKEGGALSAMKPGAIWVDCSTVNPSFTDRAGKIAQDYSIHFLDAPVAGTKPHAENAELVFFVGGQEAILALAKPYMEMMGKKVMHLGKVGKGSSFKMLVNIMLAQSMLIFSEAVVLGEKMGLDRNFLLDTLPNLVVSAPFTKFKSQMIKEGNYEVQFPLEWMHKDLHLATVSSYELQQPLYLANLAKELYADAVDRGMGRLDFAAIHQLIEKK